MKTATNVVRFEACQRSYAKRMFASALSVSTALMLLASPFAQAQSCSFQSPAKRLPLVELYTSEGCSSCPPADQWLATLTARPDAVALSMHVNYWDYIGWKDPFAKAEFTTRQRWLAGINRNATIYTPGIFVASREFREWGNSADDQRVFNRYSSVASAAAIRVNQPAAKGDAWRIDAALTDQQVDLTDTKRLFVATSHNGAQVKVKAGENSGRTLSHNHVVQYWSGALASKTPGRFEWQGVVSADADEVVAFVQDTKTGEVLQAFKVNAKNACKG